MKMLMLPLSIWLLSMPAMGYPTSTDGPNLTQADLTQEEVLPPLTPFPEDYDPADPNYERYYDPETGAPIDEDPFGYLLPPMGGCYRVACSIFLQISIAEQRAYLYVNGQHSATWKVSTGLSAPTKRWDNHPTNRVYDRYNSTRYPGGDWKGLGNMPYAIFYYGGFAVHGTPKSNWPKLGSKASHGCIRLHPDSAFKLNRLVRYYGVKNTWFHIY